MAFKHQTESFRIKDGVLFECWMDTFDRESAKGAVKDIRQAGRPAFFQKIDNGVWRIFVAAVA